MFKSLFIRCLILVLIFNVKVNAQNSCGVPRVAQGNIFFGSDVKHGQYPWMSVIMRRDFTNKFNFICGGSLISSKNVLTAAHCILENDNAIATLPRNLRVLLGMFDLDDTYELGRESISVDKIHMHDDWNPSTIRFDADIALIELGHAVIFSSYIQPVCLWTSSTDPTAVNGIVVGYGLSEKSGENHEKLPKVLELPIHTQEDCFLEKPNLAPISSRRTFCAGAGEGSGVCRGDSGGGLFIKVSNVYYLRGIVSASLVIGGQCDIFNYAVFTNVLKFSDWIKSKMNLMNSFQPATVKSTLKPRTMMQYTTTTTTRSTVQSYEECGVMSSSTGLIQGGTFSTLIDFPWVALIKIDQEFYESGALISHKHVVTSALTISYWDEETKKYANVALNRVKVHLGALHEFNSRQVFDPVEFFNHPQYDRVDDTPVNDVAVITLDRRVEFDEFIRPVCLWIFDDDLKWIANSPIYAVGYGRDETGEISKIKKHAKVALEDQQKCEETYSSYPNVTKTICIKGSEAGAPCSYDIQIFVKINDKWYLRGTASKAFYNKNETCNYNYPYLYEDNAQHSQWIQTQIDA